VNNRIKIFFIFVSFWIFLILSGGFHNQSASAILTSPVSVQTEITKNITADENSVVQSNTCIKYFVNRNRHGAVFYSGLGFVPAQNIKSEFKNICYNSDFLNIFRVHFSLYLRNEICTRAP